MRNILILIFLTLFALPQYAARTIVRGVVTGKAEGTVRLISYADQVSYKKVVLCDSRIEKDGTFSLSVELEETLFTLLELDYQQGELFVGPGLEYSVRIVPDRDIQIKAYYDREPLGIYILDEPEGGINKLVSAVNILYDEFLIENARLVQGSSSKEKLNQAVQSMREAVKTSSDPYLNGYLQYKIATLEMFFRAKSNQTLARDYLTGHPVFYSNVEYMDFFHLYFEKYLLTNNKYLPYSKTSSLINGESGLQEILAEFSKDPVLADPRLAELVLLAGLKEMSGNTGFKQPRILFLLDEISVRSGFKEHRSIAKNLKERILWMKPGSPAPDFLLEEVSGQVYSLEDYRGRSLYLSFISLSSPASLAEMNLLADIYGELKHRFHFVSIITDDLQPGWQQVIKDYRMDWDLLKASGDYNLFDSYGATAPPLFLLIDPAGNIARYPAPSPSEELKGFLEGF
jgi:peroxiredoxin